jgi:nucleoside-diphosphate-sugar epimerase
MKILVTGASGFLGRAVCGELLGRNHDVAALVRRPGSEPPGTRPLAGDLGDGASLTETLEGEAPQCVIHLAAEIASQRSARRIESVNVHGTRRLLEACAASSQPRFIFASTVVTGEARGALLDEQARLPVQTAYGRSKQHGEQLVRDSGLESAIVRPSHIYGPGGWFAQEFVKRLKQPGRFAVVGRGENLWDVVHVQDVASAMVDVTERAPGGSLYHVADDEPVSFYEFVALAARALGVGPPRRVPAAVARLAAGRDAVLAVTRSARSSNARLKRELDWSPRYPTAREGVPQAVTALSA